MKLHSAICIYRQHHALLELKTDLGKARIEVSDIKMDLLDQDLIYLGFRELPPLLYSWQDNGGTHTEMMNGFSNDPVVVKLVRRFIDDANNGSCFHKKVFIPENEVG
ncbi:MAG: hypothetical protein LCH54_11135 [Bacteroidetes bacterium]|nr:hypothetical protein [Bacteroidota bacterium]